MRLLPAVPLITFSWKVTFEQFHKEWIFIVFSCWAAKREVYASNRWLQLACVHWNVIQIKRCIILPLELWLCARVTSFLANFVWVLRFEFRVGCLSCAGIGELYRWDIAAEGWDIQDLLYAAQEFLPVELLFFWALVLRGNCSDEHFRPKCFFLFGEGSIK